MVQTVIAPDGDVNLDQLWKDISPDQLMDSKLKCVFELPAEQNETQEEPSKASPKIPVQTTANNTGESELQKAAAEVSKMFICLWMLIMFKGYTLFVANVYSISLFQI